MIFKLTQINIVGGACVRAKVLEAQQPQIAISRPRHRGRPAAIAATTLNLVHREAPDMPLIA